MSHVLIAWLSPAYISLGRSLPPALRLALSVQCKKRREKEGKEKDRIFPAFLYHLAGEMRALVRSRSGALTRFHPFFPLSDLHSSRRFFLSTLALWWTQIISMGAPGPTMNAYRPAVSQCKHEPHEGVCKYISWSDVYALNANGDTG
ncbi:hypothetical protein B0H13DRAFT_1204486 [Mycena leptocephala]|nr:hypothetical protein B0H13DRAFT_1204486 [Mycena leptocephala]